MVKGNNLKASNSRKIYLPVYLMVFVLFSTIIYIQYSGKELNQFAFQAALLFSLLLIGFTEAHRFYNKYEIDANALMHTQGILVRNTRRTDLLAVSDADISQNPWQMLLGYGTVHARVFSRDSTMNIENINNPKGFVEFLEMKINEKRAGSSGGSRSNR